MKPTPGSKEAIKQGCTCPVLDNNHGKGEGGNFWYSQYCPVHDDRNDKPESMIPGTVYDTEYKSKR